MLLVKIISLQL